MTDFALAPQDAVRASPPRLKALQLGLLWLVGASGAIVFIEPSPYEIAIVLALGVLAVTGGLRLAPALIVPIGLLIGIELGTVSALSA